MKSEMKRWTDEEKMFLVRTCIKPNLVLSEISEMKRWGVRWKDEEWDEENFFFWSKHVSSQIWCYLKLVRWRVRWRDEQMKKIFLGPNMCHSDRPFCTRCGRVFSLVGWTPGPSAWLSSPGGLEDRQAWIRRIFPPRMQEDTSLYTHACVVEPTEVYKRRHIGPSSQSVLDSRVVNNPGPSWDFYPGLLRLVCSPLRRRKLFGSHRSSFSAWGIWQSAPDRRRLHQTSAVNRFRHNHLS